MEITRETAKGIGPCIYKITSPAGRIYIGQTVNFWRRYRAYRAGHSTVNDQVKLARSFKKYGFAAHSFEIVAQCEISQLNELELATIAFCKSASKAGLNCLGGGNSLHTPSKATIEKRAKKLIGRVHSAETKQKISAANSGQENGMHGKSPWNKGKTHKPESIEKMRQNAFRHSGRLGAKHTAETLQLISEKTKGKNVGASNPGFKGFIVAHTTEGVYAGRYEGLAAAAAALAVSFKKISMVLLGKQKQTGGYTFKREENETSSD